MKGLPLRLGGRDLWKRLPPNLRKSILERDKYICQVCGSKVGKGGRRAHVHHRQGHRVPRSNARIRLITLCPSCHRLVGWLAGNSKALLANRGLLEKAIQLSLEHIKAMDG